MTLLLSETEDAILGGALKVIQPRTGYRFSIDSILLARFATARSRDRVLELGAGCGVVSLIIAAAARPREIIGIEIQPALADMAERNARVNELPNLRCVCTDISATRISGIKPASFDLVVANPPFHARSAGRESPNQSRRQARGGEGASLVEFIGAARRYVRNGGRVAMIFAASRSAELIIRMRENRLEPKRIRFVHPRAGLPASSVLIESRADGGVEAIVEPPLCIQEKSGHQSKEVRRMLERV